LGVQVTGPELEAIEARLKAADEVHPPVVRWELRCAHGLSIATTTKSPPVDWSVNGGRAQCCSECDDDEAEDYPSAPSVHSWTSQAYTEEKMSKEDVRALVAEVRRLQGDRLRARTVGLQEAAAFLGMALTKMEQGGMEDAPAGDVVAALIEGLLTRASDGFPDDELSTAAKTEIAADLRVRE